MVLTVSTERSNAYLSFGVIVYYKVCSVERLQAPY